MRLAPIDRPPTLFARVIFAVMTRLLGKVPTPYRVVFARMPQALFAHMMMVGVLDRRVRFDPDLKVMLESHVAALNGCTFCLDLVQAMALKRNPALRDKLARLDAYRTDPIFSAAERAALAYVEAIAREHHVDDATFEELRRHFDEKTIVEITWVNALEQYFNAINVGLGIGSDGFCTLPGGAPGLSLATLRASARA
ncbi:MAG: carboxymuconolactone decarboxylase family protein [Candidatus Binatia bacterium]